MRLNPLAASLNKFVSEEVYRVFKAWGQSVIAPTQLREVSAYGCSNMAVIHVPIIDEKDQFQIATAEFSIFLKAADKAPREGYITELCVISFKFALGEGVERGVLLDEAFIIEETEEQQGKFESQIKVVLSENIGAFVEALDRVQ